ncbi:MAG TPA: hypothetical protein VEX17_01930 [Bacillales bacterium]|nr:hypothetical protein [Bacillales bacterium]
MSKGKKHTKLKRPEAILAVLITIIGGIIIYNIVNSFPSRSYSLEVDALKDPESLHVNSRVVLKNSGLQPLNDINVVYDKNIKFNEKINTIKPGETIILSPPSGASLDSVNIKTREGIDINKEFRSPIKLPGMIGS